MNPHSKENEVRCLTGCVTAIVGAFAGMYVFWMLAERWLAMTDPNPRVGGQYGMEGLFIFPAGALVGGILGFCIPYWLPRRKG
jgi:hypothetical protein